MVIKISNFPLRNNQCKVALGRPLAAIKPAIFIPDIDRYRPSRPSQGYFVKFSNGYELSPILAPTVEKEVGKYE